MTGPMMELAIVVAAVVVVGLGFRSGAARARGLLYQASRTADDVFAAFMQLNVEDPAECDAECTRWARARRERIAQEQAIYAARQSIGATQEALTRALAQAAAALALALSAAFIPFIGWSVATAFFAVAAGFAAYAAYLLAVLLAAEQALQAALTKLGQSRAEEAAAYLALAAHCPVDVVARCEGQLQSLLEAARSLHR